MKKIILILLLLNLNNHVYSIEPDIFVQSTVNRASQILSKNISKEQKIDELKSIAKELDVFIESTEPLERVKNLITAAKKGCFIEQTLGQKNIINHKLRDGDSWVDV